MATAVLQQDALSRIEPRSAELLRTMGTRAKRSMLMATESEFYRLISRQQHTLEVRTAAATHTYCSRIFARDSRSFAGESAFVNLPMVAVPLRRNS